MRGQWREEGLLCFPAGIISSAKCKGGESGHTALRGQSGVGLEVIIEREQVLGAEEPSTCTRANEPGSSPTKGGKLEILQRKEKSPSL